MTAELKGRRVLIVGASSGIGRAVALELSRMGADLALGGRRAHLLDAVAEECLGLTVCCPLDIRDPASCERIVSDAVGGLGGLDALIYCAAHVALARMAEATADDWRSTLETNVIGASLCTAAAISHLEASNGIAIYLSSTSTVDEPPWAGNGLYLTSKLALEAAIRSWRGEHPTVAFTTLRVGPTAGEHSVRSPRASEFGPLWLERGHISGRRLDPVEHARAIAYVLSHPGSVDEITVNPR